jgi:hypothetical protein
MRALTLIVARHYEEMALLAFNFLARVEAVRIDAHPPHMGYARSSVFFSRSCCRSMTWIRGRARSHHAATRTASPHIRSGVSHPDHNPSCSRASGSEGRDHPFWRHVSAMGLDSRSPPARIRRAGRDPVRRITSGLGRLCLFGGMSQPWGLTHGRRPPGSDGPVAIRSAGLRLVWGAYALKAAPCGTMPCVT